MSKFIYNPYSDLWKGEQKIIAELASKVPDHGTIVEIGTFQGGTAQMFHEITHHRGIQTYTIDIAPLQKAYEILKGTEVKMIIKPSLEAAESWKKSINKHLDLLFIDGSHKFQNVFEDFNAWINLLKPDGIVAFHDYDPIERGGVAHLGVKTCIEGILSSNLLKNTRHQYKLFYGSPENFGNTELKLEDCKNVLLNLADEINKLIETDYANWTLVADDRLAFLLNGCLKLENCSGPIFPKEANESDKKYLVSAHPLGLPLDILQINKIKPENIRIIDSLKLCYIINLTIETNFEYLLKVSSNKGEFLRSAEMLEMMNHIYGASIFPNQLSKFIETQTLDQFSKLIAAEQIKLNALTRIVKSFVEWTP